MDWDQSDSDGDDDYVYFSAFYSPFIHNSANIQYIAEYPLTERDRDNIRAFWLRFNTRITRRDFRWMKNVFSHKITIDSEWKIIRQIAKLADVDPVYIDCCIKSCLAYTGEYSNKSVCKYCKEPRYNSQGKPRRLFCYIPLIPQLRGMFESVHTCRLLSYRSNFEVTGPGLIKDVFDGLLYQKLLKKRVRVNGQKLKHRYFSNATDIAFSVCTDGFLLFN
ncbi:hypothetical protein BKA70DRAFT_1115959, partial [Coprinopsis sp. MPI-PUGE-AT-0042]